MPPTDSISGALAGGARSAPSDPRGPAAAALWCCELDGDRLMPAVRLAARLAGRGAAIALFDGGAVMLRLAVGDGIEERAPGIRDGLGPSTTTRVTRWAVPGDADGRMLRRIAAPIALDDAIVGALLGFADDAEDDEADPPLLVLEDVAGVLAQQMLGAMDLYTQRRRLMRRERTLVVETRARDHLELVQRLAGIGSWEVRVDETQPRVTDGARHVLGIQAHRELRHADELLGAVPRDAAEAPRAARAQVFETGQDLTHRFRVIDPLTGATRWIEERVACRRNSQGREIGLVGVLRDVTEAHAEQLDQEVAERLQLIGQMTGGIAHDFNNLVTLILGQAGLLDEAAADPDAREALDGIIDAGRQAGDMATRMLSFVRSEDAPAEDVDAAVVLRSLGGILRRTLPPGIELEVDCDAGPAPLHCSRTELEAAILNLAINARDAMPDGGPLRLSARQLGGDTPRVRIAVRDGGTGIAPVTAHRAFEPFFTTKGPGRGSGLGLSMVRRFAEDLGGRAEIVIPAEGGTEVALVLPLHRASAKGPAQMPAALRPRVDSRSTPAASSRSAPAPGTPARVLVIDDDRMVLNLLDTMLGRLGYSPVLASDGPSAIEAFAESGPFDLVMCDLNLADGVRGTTVVNVLAEGADDGLAVMFVSGEGGVDVSAEVRGATVHTTLAKPFTVAELSSRLKGALGPTSIAS